VLRTKVDALAIACGTSHGAYKFSRKPDGDILAMNVIEAIHRKIPNTHLVMHGSSSVPQELQDIINAFGGEMPQTFGVPVEEIVRGIRHGVRKVNIDTDCRMASRRGRRKLDRHLDHVWTDLLTDLDHYKGRAYRVEDVPGDSESFYAFIAYPIDLFEEGSVVNVLTSLVGNVFGFKALRHLRLEDMRFPIAYIKTCGGPPAGIQLERDKLNKYGRRCSAPPSSRSSACRPRTTAAPSTSACAAVWT
jgi:hypothetical protein